jgi:hypothetical protein
MKVLIHQMPPIRCSTFWMRWNGGLKLIEENAVTEFGLADALQEIEDYVMLKDTTTHFCVGCGFAARRTFGSYTVENGNSRKASSKIIDFNTALDYLLTQSKARTIDKVYYGRIYELFSTLIRSVIENEDDEADWILQTALATIKDLELMPSRTEIGNEGGNESKPPPLHITMAGFKSIESVLADELRKFYPNITAALLLLDCTESILSRSSQNKSILSTSISLQSLTSLLNGMMLRQFLSVHPECQTGSAMTCLLGAIGSRIAGDRRPQDHPLQDGNAEAIYSNSLDITDCRNLITLCKAVPRKVACENLSKILAGALSWNTNTRYNFNEAGMIVAYRFNITLYDMLVLKDVTLFDSRILQNDDICIPQVYVFCWHHSKKSVWKILY